EARHGVQQHVEPKRAPRKWPASALCRQEQREDQKLGASLVQLRGVEWDAKRRADVGGRIRVGKDDAPRLGGWPAVAAAGEEAPETPDDVAKRDAGRKDIARRPQRKTRAADIPQRDTHGRNQAAV